MSNNYVPLPPTLFDVPTNDWKMVDMKKMFRLTSTIRRSDPDFRGFLSTNKKWRMMQKFILLDSKIKGYEREELIRRARCRHPDLYDGDAAIDRAVAISRYRFRDYRRTDRNRTRRA